ncbi:MAG: hypothetical protein ACR2P9_08680 [Gammaproteobacteria bacterium]
MASVFAIFAISIGIVSMNTEYAEAASADGEPTMFVNGINANQTNNYIYVVPPGSIEFGTALMIKDLEEKNNVYLNATDPFGFSTICPMAPLPPFKLLVSECSFFMPIPGIWNIAITAGPITNNPLGYAIAADTIHDEQMGQNP